MSQKSLNLLAGALFAFAAVANLLVGPLWLAILFAVLAVASLATANRR